MRTKMMSLRSNSKSIHEPRYGNDASRCKRSFRRVRLPLSCLKRRTGCVELRDDDALLAFE